MEGRANRKEVRVTRMIDATPDEVFSAWTDQRKMSEWWSPKMFTIPVCRVDATAGGDIYIVMRSPNGAEFPMKGRFLKIERPNLIVVATSAYFQEGGKPVIDAENTVTITRQGDRTRLDVHAVVVRADPSAEMALKGMEEGWNQSMDKLARIAERTKGVKALNRTAGGSFSMDRTGERELTITQAFTAPREEVFGAMTDPKLIPHWWGPQRYATTVERMELRPGGKWRFAQFAPDGTRHEFRGEYEVVDRPVRLAYTFEWGGMPGHISEDSYTFESIGGKTIVVERVSFQTKDDLEGMVGTGMESGLRESMERLERLLSAGAEDSRAGRAMAVRVQ